jgi:hypothetical protein
MRFFAYLPRLFVHSVALSATFCLLLLCFVATANGGTVVVDFNHYGEAGIELILLLLGFTGQLLLIATNISKVLYRENLYKDSRD